MTNLNKRIEPVVSAFDTNERSPVYNITERNLGIYDRCIEELKLNMEDVLRIIGDYKSENKFSVIKMYLAFVYIELFVKTYIPIDYYITTDWSKQKNYVYHHNIAVLLEIAEENKKIPGKVSLIIKSNILQIEKYFRSNIGGEKINKYASMRYNFEKDRKADFKKIHFFFEDRQNEDVLFLYKKVTSDIIEELRYEQ